MPCLDEDTVLRFISGLLGPDEQEAVERHIAGCDECRWLLSMGGAGALEDPSGLPTAPGHLEEEAAVEEAPRIEVGTVLNGTYRIERLIGKGGMGTVFEASHLRLPRRFAIKVIAEHHHAAEEAIARFRREAEVTGRLAHPHIVEVVDFDFTERGTPFLVMELLEGEPLSERLKREGTIADFATFAAIVCETASALQEAHQHGVVHRDLKPTNIFLCQRAVTDNPLAADAVRPESVKVMDFGVSKILSAKNELTSHLAVLGSPSYMAPEQARGRSAEADQRADIFALGAIMFRMLAGQPPFTGDSVPVTLFNVVYGEPVNPERWLKVPRPLRQVILRAMSKDPDARPLSMPELWAEVFQAMRRSGQGEALKGLADPGRPGRRWIGARLGRRARIALALSGLAVVVVAGITVASWMGSSGGQGPSAALPTDMRPSPASRPATPVAASSLPAVARPDAAMPAPHRRPRARRRRRARFGTLTIQSRDGRHGPAIWTQVLLDGKRVGRTPLTLRRVPVGAHRIRVEREGYRAAWRRVRVRDGVRTVVSFAMRSSGPRAP